MEEIQSLVDISHIQNEAGWSPVIRFIVVPPVKMVNARHKTVSFPRAACGYRRYRYNAATRSVVSLARRRTKFDQY